LAIGGLTFPQLLLVYGFYQLLEPKANNILFLLTYIFDPLPVFTDILPGFPAYLRMVFPVFTVIIGVGLPPFPYPLDIVRPVLEVIRIPIPPFLESLFTVFFPASLLEAYLLAWMPLIRPEHSAADDTFILLDSHIESTERLFSHT
jgi:hypothetical protein